MKNHGLNPRIRKSPFFDATIASGATAFHPYNGMWMPVGYDTPVNEYWNTIARAGLAAAFAQASPTVLQIN